MNQKDKKKKRNVWLIVIGLVVALGTLTFIFWDTIKSWFQKKDKTGKTQTDYYDNLADMVKHEIGVEEWSGKSESNPDVEKYFEAFGYGDKDDTPWCAAAANYILKNAGFEYAGKHNSLSPLRARDLERVNGLDIQDYSKARKHVTVVVSWRISLSAGTGHCGFFVEDTGDVIRVAGGNQSDAFNEDKIVPYNRITRVFTPEKKLT